MTTARDNLELSVALAAEDMRVLTAQYEARAANCDAEKCAAGFRPPTLGTGPMMTHCRLQTLGEHFSPKIAKAGGLSWQLISLSLQSGDLFEPTTCFGLNFSTRNDFNPRHNKRTNSDPAKLRR